MSAVNGRKARGHPVTSRPTPAKRKSWISAPGARKRSLLVWSFVMLLSPFKGLFFPLNGGFRKWRGFTDSSWNLLTVCSFIESLFCGSTGVNVDVPAFWDWTSPQRSIQTFFSPEVTDSWERLVCQHLLTLFRFVAGCYTVVVDGNNKRSSNLTYFVAPEDWVQRFGFLNTILYWTRPD